MCNFSEGNSLDLLFMQSGALDQPRPYFWDLCQFLHRKCNKMRECALKNAMGPQTLQSAALNLQTSMMSAFY
jgi:hypothetical protein